MMPFSVGDIVEWTAIVGGVRRGFVSRIKLGTVYVKLSQVNTHGRRVSRTVECFFEPHELGRLRAVRP
jgi:hypothetical protein